MKQDVAPIVERLKETLAGLEAAAKAVPAERWREPPRAGAWSAAEVMAHLTMVESGVSGRAAKLLKIEPRPVPIWKRVHLPVRLAQWRRFKAKTPIPLDPKLVGEKEEMLARYAGLRQGSIALLEESRERDLGAYRWNHPFFGSLNFYDWFRMLFYHEARHIRQIREIEDSFHR